jgi:thiol:disulfide interchange protein
MRTPLGVAKVLSKIVLTAFAVLALTAGCDVYDEPATAVADRSNADPWSGLSESQRPQAGTIRQAGIEYVEGYDSALARAAAERKPVLVLFRASWCRWCGDMTGRVLSEERVVRQSHRFVCVAVDADRDREICRRHDIRGFPTILLLGDDGREIARRTGRVGPAELASLLEKVEVDPTTLATPVPRTVR